ncbi:plasma membrane fusion protein prm1 [Rhodotorula kratochvilovae]
MATYPPPPSYPVHLPFGTPAYPQPYQRALKPYLGPRAHLSLSWLSQHFLALLLVLVALAFLLAQIPALVADAKSSLNAACAGVEGAASVAVSLPHYMADGVNEMNVRAVNALSEGAGTVLDLMLQALEAIVLFMIDMYRSLFLCLLDLAVHGSITVLVKGIEEAQEFVTDALGGVRTAIQESISGVNTLIDHTVGLIDDIPGVDIDVPQIDVPELSALENVTLPDTLIHALTELNSSIPTLDEFRSGLDSLISTPIEALRSSINATLRNSSIDVELLPVPAKETVSLCADLDTSWIDDVGSSLGTFVKVAIGLVVLAMALFIAASALWEHYRYRAFLGGVGAARDAWLSDLLSASGASDPHAHVSTAQETLSTPNLLSFLNASSHPTLFRLLARLSALLRLETPEGKTNLIWFLSYIAHPYAWAFLALGLVGLVVVQIQLAVLDGPVRRMTREKAETGAGEFSTSVAETMNAKMEAAGAEWANGTNRVIQDVQDGVNENLFGWVNDATRTLNSTMNGFYTEITDAVTSVFNGTILEDPALGLVYCLIGSKVDAVSTALTWLHNHAHLSLPLVSPSLLTLSQNRTDDLTASLTNPNSTVSAPSIADRMIDAYRRSLEQQRMGFVLALGVWALVLLMGLVGVWWRARGEVAWRRWRRRGGRDADEALHEEKAPPGAADEEKRAFFKPLHLRSLSTFGRTRGAGDAHGGASFPPLQPMEHQHPYPFDGPYPRGGPYPSSASWASLIDYFKPTPPADASAPSFTSAAEARPHTPPRALALPSLALLSLPSLRRPPASPSHRTAKGSSRLKPLISRPSRPLSAFRSLRDSHFARAPRRRASDAAPLRGEDAVGERRYALPPSATGGQGWKERIKGRTRDRRARRAGGVADGGEKADDGWEEMHDEPAQGEDPCADARGPTTTAAAYPAPPALPSSADPLADPLTGAHGRAQSSYAPSSRPLVMRAAPPARGADPFATPFDAVGER